MEKRKFTERINIPIAIVSMLVIAVLSAIVFRSFTDDMDVTSRVALTSFIRGLNLIVGILIGVYFSKERRNARANKKS